MLDGPKLVTVAVGDEPTSPLTTVPGAVDPVTPELPRAPNWPATPKVGATCADAGDTIHKNTASLALTIKYFMGSSHCRMLGFQPRSVWCRHQIFNSNVKVHFRTVRSSDNPSRI